MMEPVQGCPLLASSPGRLWDTFSKRCPSFSRGWFFFLERPCREAPKPAVLGITKMPDLLVPGARMQESSWAGFAHWSPNGKPLRGAQRRAQKACKVARQMHSGFFSSSFASSASPNHAIPSKTGFLAANPSQDSTCLQRPAGRRQARP